MKAKTLLPMVAICLGGSLWTGPVLADQVRTIPPPATAPNWNLSRVLDATVKDADGDNLGRIKDVVLDPATGRPTFAVIQLSDRVEPKGSYAPVPWQLLTPIETTATGEPKTFALNMTRDQFASAQRFYLNHWPDNNEATWGPQVYADYGLQPQPGYSVGGTGFETETQTQTGISSDYYKNYGNGRYGPTRPDGTPIDNGTAPDGKGTFVRGPRYNY